MTTDDPAALWPADRMHDGMDKSRPHVPLTCQACRLFAAQVAVRFTVAEMRMDGTDRRMPKWERINKMLASAGRLLSVIDHGK